MARVSHDGLDHRTASVNAPPPASAAIASTFRAWIDEPVGGRPQSTRFVVRGWCYHTAGIRVVAIRARYGGRIFPGVYGDPRADVAAAFPGEPGADQSGYEVPVVSPGRPVSCDIEAQLPDGAWHLVESAALEAPARRRWLEPVRWGWFWAQAWFGRPQAWTALTEAQRDFVVAAVRVRGWFNLFVGPQYPARSLRPEAFPASRLNPAQLPRVTIVTPSFQQGAFLEETMRSVLGQQGVAIDYVVQDGGSTDGSVEVIRRHAGRLAGWESAADGGQADAVRRGFSRVPAGPDDLMMYLNSDDLLLPGAARFVAEYFAAHPAVDVVYGHRVIVDDRGREIGRWLTPRPRCNDLRFHDLIPQETLFWRRRIWDRAGGVDPSFQFALDWDLLLRFAAAGARFARLPWALAAFRLHPQQKTSTRLVDDGMPEMDRLRRRTLGRAATHDELHLAMRRAQLDSALVQALLARGWRV